LAHARVEDAMRAGLISVSRETPLREVARTLATKHVHCVVVERGPKLGGGGRCGLISTLDLLAAGADEAFEDRTAADLAVAEPPVVATDDDLERAAKLMSERRVEHLLVLDAADGHPVGMLSALDVAGVMAWGEA
jgi:CBS domain-containing protein